MRLYFDNKSTIRIAQNPVQHDWIKNIEVDRHFIQEKLESGLICNLYSMYTFKGATSKCLYKKA